MKEWFVYFDETRRYTVKLDQDTGQLVLTDGITIDAQVVKPLDGQFDSTVRPN